MCDLLEIPSRFGSFRFTLGSAQLGVGGVVRLLSSRSKREQNQTKPNHKHHITTHTPHQNCTPQRRNNATMFSDAILDVCITFCSFSFLSFCFCDLSTAWIDSHKQHKRKVNEVKSDIQTTHSPHTVTNTQHTNDTDTQDEQDKRHSNFTPGVGTLFIQFSFPTQVHLSHGLLS